MEQQQITLPGCSVTFETEPIVHLHIFDNVTLSPEQVEEVFAKIEESGAARLGLLVTAGDKATLSQEARNIASADRCKNLVADAIVTEHYAHQMTANFYTRYNHPARPTKLFKDAKSARQWLLEQLADQQA